MNSKSQRILRELIILMIIFVRDRTARCRRPLRRGACRKNAECGTWFNSEFGMRNAELFVGKGSAYIKPFRYICRGGACRLPSILSAHENISAVGKHLPFVSLCVVGSGLDLTAGWKQTFLLNPRHGYGLHPDPLSPPIRGQKQDRALQNV